VIKIKKKVKTLLPTLKEKKRYIAFEVVSKEKINNFNDISKEIMSKSLELIGNLGVAQAGIQILKEKWNPKLQRGLIRINNKHVDKLKSAFTFVEKIKNKEAIVKSVGVSGMLNKAEKKYLN